MEVERTPFAYREVGPTIGIPVVFLHHFTAVLDDWDPAVVDGIAAERRVILAGTAPAGDPGPASTGAILQAALEKAGAQGKHPKHFLFFSPTATSQAAADAFLARLDERTEVRDAAVSNETIGAQITALARWEQGTSPVGLTSCPTLSSASTQTPATAASSSTTTCSWRRRWNSSATDTEPPPPVAEQPAPNNESTSSTESIRTR